MKKKIIISIAIVVIFVVANFVIISFLNNDNAETVQYDGSHNVTDNDDNNEDTI